MAYDNQEVQQAVQVSCERLLLPDETFGRQQGGTQHVLFGTLERLVSMYSETTPAQCENWSENADAAYKLHGKSARLHVEHVVERVSIVVHLGKAKNAEEIRQALKLATTCVVLERLRHHVDTASIEQAWERYKQAGITVIRKVC